MRILYFLIMVRYDFIHSHDKLIRFIHQNIDTEWCKKHNMWLYTTINSSRSLVKMCLLHRFTENVLKLTICWWHRHFSDNFITQFELGVCDMDICISILWCSTFPINILIKMQASQYMSKEQIIQHAWNRLVLS